MKLPITNVKNLLRSHGWQLKEKHTNSDKFFLFRNPLYESRELTLPTKEDAPDYSDAVSILLNKLAAIENTLVEKLIREIEKATYDQLPDSSDDLILRVVKPTEDGEAIPLTLARTALEEAEVLILTGSCHAQNPKPYYRLIGNKTSNSLLERAFFNHTQHGSFVLTVSCPILAIGEQYLLSLETTDLPITRKSFLAIRNGISELQSAISNEKYIELAKDTLLSKNPLLSANLAQAIGNIVASDTGGGIEFAFNFSELVQPPENFEKNKSFAFTRENAKKIYEFAATLRPQEKPLKNRFIGTVEALRGDLNDDGKRAGVVELALLIPEIGWTRATAELDAVAYKLADSAHINGAQFVAITGTLEPRPRVWVFSSIDSFEHVASP